jgi:hypothetical protein
MKQLPDAASPIVNDGGVLNEQTRLYLQQVEELLSGQIFPTLPEYANLAALQAAIKNPVKGKIYGFLPGQGQAVYNGSDFVRASDYSTLIV